MFLYIILQYKSKTNFYFLTINAATRSRQLSNQTSAAINTKASANCEQDDTGSTGVHLDIPTSGCLRDNSDGAMLWRKKGAFLV